MKQLVCRKTGQVELVDASVPVAGDGELLVRLSACGICGTDVMKVYDPAVAKPVQIGHEIVGRVERGSPGFVHGQRVAVAHHAPEFGSHYSRRGSETQDPQFKRSNVDPGGFAELIRVPSELVMQTVHAIPDHVPDLRAVFMEPLACCLRAVERGGVGQGDTVLIVGCGAIGILFVPLLRHCGAQVIAADVRQERLDLAVQWGVVSANYPDAELPTLVRQHSEGRGADVVILTAVNAATLDIARQAVRDGGWIIPFGVKPGTVLPFDFWDIYRREVSVLTSYSATPAGLKQAMALLTHSSFALENLAGHQIPMMEGQRAFDLLHEAKASKIIITP